MSCIKQCHWRHFLDSWSIDVLAMQVEALNVLTSNFVRTMTFIVTSVPPEPAHHHESRFALAPESHRLEVSALRTKGARGIRKYSAHVCS
jgi:hypothetical protein